MTNDSHSLLELIIRVTYRWSSYRQDTALGVDRIVTPHEVYQRLGRCNSSRVNSYKELFKDQLSQRDLSEIRNAVIFSMPLGNSKLQDQIKKAIGRKLGYVKLDQPLAKQS